MGNHSGHGRAQRAVGALAIGARADDRVYVRCGAGLGKGDDLAVGGNILLQVRRAVECKLRAQLPICLIGGRYDLFPRLGDLKQMLVQVLQVDTGIYRGGG